MCFSQYQFALRGHRLCIWIKSASEMVGRGRVCNSNRSLEIQWHSWVGHTPKLLGVVPTSGMWACQLSVLTPPSITNRVLKFCLKIKQCSVAISVAVLDRNRILLCCVFLSVTHYSTSCASAEGGINTHFIDVSDIRAVTHRIRAPPIAEGKH